MIPVVLRATRLALGLSTEGLAKLVQVESGRTVRRWEAGERAIPGPVVVLITAIATSAAVREFFGLKLSDQDVESLR